ncbi:MAG: sugar ABC transporter substrate-binding protein [Planctomycetes bacterium]|nr:sugar ABC transporter substrate-binding protein [Planctomycetota bacterium]
MPRLRLSSFENLYAAFQWFAGVCVLFFAAASCEPNAAEREPVFTPKFRIFIVGEGENEPTWPALQAAAARFQKDDGKNEIIAITPKQNSPREQQELLDNLLQRGPSAVCLLPCDPTALRNSVNKLVTSGCLVVTFVRDVSESKRSCFCGPSELDIGKQAAAACSLALANHAQTAITLNAESRGEVYRMRSHAFRQELAILGSILIIKQLNCSGDPFEAANLVHSESKKYPRTGCWVLFDDWPLRVTPSSERLLPLGCRIVLCNGNPKYLERVRKGEIQAMVTIDFFDAVKQAYMAARGRAENPMIELPTYHSVDTLTISMSELDWYGRCWESWKRGLPSPPDKPWE